MRFTNLAQRLSWARSVVGVSGSELEWLAEIGGTNVHFIEQRGRVPGTEILSKIARAMGVSLDWLVDERGPEPTPEEMAVAVVHARKAAQKRPDKIRPTGTGDGPTKTGTEG